MSHTGSMQITLFRGCTRMIPLVLWMNFYPILDRQVETSLQSYYLAKPDLQPLVPTCTLDHHRDVILDNLSYRLWTIDINIVQGAAKCYTFTMLVATEISEISECLEKASQIRIY